MGPDGERAAEYRARLDKLTTRQLAITVFDDEEHADWWLAMPQKFLGGEIPNALIDAGREDEVRRRLHQIDDNVYL